MKNWNMSTGRRGFYFQYLLLGAFVFLTHFTILAQTTVSGTVKDAATGERLPGATVIVEGTTDGITTDLDGKFEFTTTKKPPFNLKVSYVGYETLLLPVSRKSTGLSIQLHSGNQQLNEVEIRGSRISEERKKEPLTMETMDIIAIKQTPAPDFYDGLGNLAGVDLTTASLGFKVINTRGFNSTSPVRSLQIIDGVDNQSPGLNFSLGNFLGAPELDIQKVDMIQGAASAYYGPNAFNGVISMTTQDPFVHRGFSAMMKMGERSLYESAFRWADAMNNKKDLPVFAYKINFSYLQAQDWEANNYDPVDGSLVGKDNPGRYDAVNIYGDEFFPLNDASGVQAWSDEAGLGIYYRTGYMEKDLVDYNTQNIKANMQLRLRLRPDSLFNSPELIYASNFGNGTTVYQGDNRFSLRDILFFQNKLELHKKDRYFLRIYSTHENSGRSYDPYNTALRLQNSVMDDEDWSLAYRTFWKSNIRKKMRENGYPDLEFDPVTFEFTFDQSAADQWMQQYHDSLVFWHNMAQQWADSRDPEFLQPGSPSFQSEFDRITSAKNNSNEKGTLFYDRSALYHVQGEYRFTPSFVKEIKAGFSGRLYTPKTDGTIFSDTSGRVIRNYEYGVYAGFTKDLANDKLSLSATIRSDKNQNFNYVFSPAASLVWNPSKDNYFRLSFSSALRNPTLADQYLFLNVGRAILAGNLSGADSLITISSFQDYRNSLNTNKLVYFNIDPVRPERVKTLEVGYRTILWEKIFIDAGFYFNFYQDFLGYNIGIDADIGQNGLVRDLTIFRYAANSTQNVTTQGFNIGIKYFIGQYELGGNYSWNKLNAIEEDPIIPAFNTPEHKFNISAGGRNIDFNIFGKTIRNVSFNVNYKWVQGFLFEGSPQFTGFIPTYDLLDAQVNWHIEKWKTTLKAGATNILNKAQFQTYGGPKIGRLAYFSVSYEWNK